MPRLSCIIPVLGTTNGLESTLVSLLEHSPNDSEIIVVLSVPYDDPYQLDEVRFLQAPPRTSLVDCLNLGLQASCAPLVCIMRPGCEMARGGLEAALAQFADASVASVSPLVTSADGARHDRPGIVAGVRCSIGGRAYRVGGALPPPSGDPSGNVLPAPLGPTLAAAFYRRSAIDLLGGGLARELGDALAEVDLALGLAAIGYRCVFEPQCRVSLHEPGALAAFHGGFRGALQAERLFWRNLAAGRWLAQLLAHPWTVVAQSLRRPWMAPLEWSARLVACCQWGDYRLRYERLRHARAAMAVKSVTRANPTRRIDAAHPLPRGASHDGQPERVVAPLAATR